MLWDSPFDDPIVRRDGKTFVALKDAAKLDNEVAKSGNCLAQHPILFINKLHQVDALDLHRVTDAGNLR